MCDGNVMDFPGSKSVKWFVIICMRLKLQFRRWQIASNLGNSLLRDIISYSHHHQVLVRSEWCRKCISQEGIDDWTELGPLDGSEITWPLEAFWGKDVLTTMPLGLVFHSLSISPSLSFWTFNFYHIMILLVIPGFTDLYLVSHLQTRDRLT